MPHVKFEVYQAKTILKILLRNKSPEFVHLLIVAAGKNLVTIICEAALNILSKRVKLSVNLARQLRKYDKLLKVISSKASGGIESNRRQVLKLLKKDPQSTSKAIRLLLAAIKNHLPNLLKLSS